MTNTLTRFRQKAGVLFVNQMLSIQRGQDGGDGLINRLCRSPLVVHRIQIPLPMLETRVQSLVREDPT